MTLIRFTLLLFSGLCAGLVTAAAYVAFISMLGIFPKFAERTKTAKECILYENCLILGILFSTFLQFFLTFQSAGYEASALPPKGFAITYLTVTGFFGGIYTGFLIGGLSEVLNVFPIFTRKTHTAKNIGHAITALALGKGVFLIINSLISR